LVMSQGRRSGFEKSAGRPAWWRSHQEPGVIDASASWRALDTLNGSIPSGRANNFDLVMSQGRRSGFEKSAGRPAWWRSHQEPGVIDASAS